MGLDKNTFICYNVSNMVKYIFKSGSAKAFASVCGAFLLSVLFTMPSFAAQLNMQSGVAAAHGTGQPTELFGMTGIFTTITNILLYIIGAISVIMLVIGGLRYVISGGNDQAVTGAKNTILYAIIGIVVALLAYAIVNFVIGAIGGDMMGGGSGGGSAAGGASNGIAPTNV